MGNLCNKGNNDVGTEFNSDNPISAITLMKPPILTNNSNH